MKAGKPFPNLEAWARDLLHGERNDSSTRERCDRGGPRKRAEALG